MSGREEIIERVDIGYVTRGEIVRCKDCLMTKERDEYTNNVWCCRHREYMDDMYYCADGLRRKDGEA